jgi:hypothetical protein
MMNRAIGQSKVDIKHPSRVRVIDPKPEFAASGWVVAADLAGLSDRRFFAVGLPEADEAVEAVLRYPGLAREDRRFAIRLLLPEEISRLRLRAQAVRPYGEALKR